MNSLVRTTAAASGLLLTASTAAHAHLVDTRLGDFYGGMFHPLTSFEDTLPWLALAILAAFQGARSARWLVVVVPAGLIAGGALSVVAPAPDFLTLLSLLLIVVTGLGVAAGAVVPLAALLGLATIMAVVQGYVNGLAMTPATDSLLFVAGVSMIGYLFVTMAMASALAFLRGSGSWRAIALRAGGSWVAAVGIMVLGVQLLTAKGV